MCESLFVVPLSLETLCIHWATLPASHVCACVVTVCKSTSVWVCGTCLFYVPSPLFQIKAVIVNVEASEGICTIAFSPYYPGCTPVMVVNLFRATFLEFRQALK